MRGLAVVTTVALTLLIGTAANGQPPPPATPEQRVATLKQWLQASQAQLRAYEWIETTTVVAKGGRRSPRPRSAATTVRTASSRSYPSRRANPDPRRPLVR